jgi:hypothetical protein
MSAAEEASRIQKKKDRAAKRALRQEAKTLFERMERSHKYYVSRWCTSSLSFRKCLAKAGK